MHYVSYYSHKYTREDGFKRYDPTE